MLFTLYVILVNSLIIVLFFHSTAFRIDFHNAKRLLKALLDMKQLHSLILQVVVNPAYKSISTGKLNQQILRQAAVQYRLF